MRPIMNCVISVIILKVIFIALILSTAANYAENFPRRPVDIHPTAQNTAFSRPPARPLSTFSVPNAESSTYGVNSQSRPAQTRPNLYPLGALNFDELEGFIIGPGLNNEYNREARRAVDALPPQAVTNTPMSHRTHSSPALPTNLHIASRETHLLSTDSYIPSSSDLRTITHRQQHMDSVSAEMVADMAAPHPEETLALRMTMRTLESIGMGIVGNVANARASDEYAQPPSLEYTSHDTPYSSTSSAAAYPSTSSPSTSSVHTLSLHAARPTHTLSHGSTHLPTTPSAGAAGVDHVHNTVSLGVADNVAVRQLMRPMGGGGGLAQTHPTTAMGGVGNVPHEHPAVSEDGPTNTAYAQSEASIDGLDRDIQVRLQMHRQQSPEWLEHTQRLPHTRGEMKTQRLDVTEVISRQNAKEEIWEGRADEHNRQRTMGLESQYTATNMPRYPATDAVHYAATNDDLYAATTAEEKARYAAAQRLLSVQRHMSLMYQHEQRQLQDRQSQDQQEQHQQQRHLLEEGPQEHSHEGGWQQLQDQLQQQQQLRQRQLLHAVHRRSTTAHAHSTANRDNGSGRISGGGNTGSGSVRATFARSSAATLGSTTSLPTQSMGNQPLHRQQPRYHTMSLPDTDSSSTSAAGASDPDISTTSRSAARIDPAAYVSAVHARQGSTDNGGVRVSSVEEKAVRETRAQMDSTTVVTGQPGTYATDQGHGVMRTLGTPVNDNSVPANTTPTRPTAAAPEESRYTSVAPPDSTVEDTAPPAWPDRSMPMWLRDGVQTRPDALPLDLPNTSASVWPAITVPISGSAVSVPHLDLSTTPPSRESAAALNTGELAVIPPMWAGSSPAWPSVPAVTSVTREYTPYGPAHASGNTAAWPPVYPSFPSSLPSSSYSASHLASPAAVLPLSGAPTWPTPDQLHSAWPSHTTGLQTPEPLPTNAIAETGVWPARGMAATHGWPNAGAWSGTGADGAAPGSVGPSARVNGNGDVGIHGQMGANMGVGIADGTLAWADGHVWPALTAAPWPIPSFTAPMESISPPFVIDSASPTSYIPPTAGNGGFDGYGANGTGSISGHGHGSRVMTTASFTHYPDHSLLASPHTYGTYTNHHHSHPHSYNTQAHHDYHTQLPQLSDTYSTNTGTEDKTDTGLRGGTLLGPSVRGSYTPVETDDTRRGVHANAFMAYPTPAPMDAVDTHREGLAADAGLMGSRPVLDVVGLDDRGDADRVPHGTYHTLNTISLSTEDATDALHSVSNTLADGVTSHINGASVRGDDTPSRDSAVSAADGVPHMTENSAAVRDGGVDNMDALSFPLGSINRDIRSSANAINGASDGLDHTAPSSADLAEVLWPVMGSHGTDAPTVAVTDVSGGVGPRRISRTGGSVSDNTATNTPTNTATDNATHLDMDVEDDMFDVESEDLGKNPSGNSTTRVFPWLSNEVDVGAAVIGWQVVFYPDAEVSVDSIEGMKSPEDESADLAAAEPGMDNRGDAASGGNTVESTENTETTSASTEKKPKTICPGVIRFAMRAPVRGYLSIGFPEFPDEMSGEAVIGWMDSRPEDLDSGSGETKSRTRQGRIGLFDVSTRSSRMIADGQYGADAAYIRDWAVWRDPEFMYMTFSRPLDLRISDPSEKERWETYQRNSEHDWNVFSPSEYLKRSEPAQIKASEFYSRPIYSGSCADFPGTLSNILWATSNRPPEMSTSGTSNLPAATRTSTLLRDAQDNLMPTTGTSASIFAATHDNIAHGITTATDRNTSARFDTSSAATATATAAAAAVTAGSPAAGSAGNDSADGSRSWRGVLMSILTLGSTSTQPRNLLGTLTGNDSENTVAITSYPVAQPRTSFFRHDSRGSVNIPLEAGAVAHLLHKTWVNSLLYTVGYFVAFFLAWMFWEIFAKSMDVRIWETFTPEKPVLVVSGGETHSRSSLDSVSPPIHQQLGTSEFSQVKNSERPSLSVLQDPINQIVAPIVAHGTGKATTIPSVSNTPSTSLALSSSSLSSSLPLSSQEQQISRALLSAWYDVAADAVQHAESGLAEPEKTPSFFRILGFRISSFITGILNTNVWWWWSRMVDEYIEANRTVNIEIHTQQKRLQAMQEQEHSRAASSLSRAHRPVLLSGPHKRQLRERAPSPFVRHLTSLSLEQQAMQQQGVNSAAESVRSNGKTTGSEVRWMRGESNRAGLDEAMEGHLPTQQGALASNAPGVLTSQVPGMSRDGEMATVMEAGEGGSSQETDMGRRKDGVESKENDADIQGNTNLQNHGRANPEIPEHPETSERMMLSTSPPDIYGARIDMDGDHNSEDHDFHEFTEHPREKPSGKNISKSIPEFPKISNLSIPNLEEDDMSFGFSGMDRHADDGYLHSLHAATIASPEHIVSANATPKFSIKAGNSPTISGKQPSEGSVNSWENGSNSGFKAFPIPQSASSPALPPLPSIHAHTSLWPQTLHNSASLPSAYMPSVVTPHTSTVAPSSLPTPATNSTSPFPSTAKANPATAASSTDRAAQTSTSTLGQAPLPPPPPLPAPIPPHDLVLLLRDQQQPPQQAQQQQQQQQQELMSVQGGDTSHNRNIHHHSSEASNGRATQSHTSSSSCSSSSTQAITPQTQSSIPPHTNTSALSTHPSPLPPPCPAVCPVYPNSLAPAASLPHGLSEAELIEEASDSFPAAVLRVKPQHQLKLNDKELDIVKKVVVDAGVKREGHEGEGIDVPVSSSSSSSSLSSPSQSPSSAASSARQPIPVAAANSTTGAADSDVHSTHTPVSVTRTTPPSSTSSSSASTSSSTSASTSKSSQRAHLRQRTAAAIQAAQVLAHEGLPVRVRDLKDYERDYQVVLRTDADMEEQEEKEERREETGRNRGGMGISPMELNSGKVNGHKNSRSSVQGRRRAVRATPRNIPSGKSPSAPKISQTELINQYYASKSPGKSSDGNSISFSRKIGNALGFDNRELKHLSGFPLFLAWVRCSMPYAVADWTVGTLLWYSVVLGGIILFAFLRYDYHTPAPYLNLLRRTTGDVAVLALALSIFLPSRIPTAFPLYIPVSWPHLVALHRAMGRLAWVAALVHMFVRWQALYTYQTGLAALVCLSALIILSVATIRRNAYQFFYVFHIIFAALTVVFVLLHQPQPITYWLLLPAVASRGLGWLMRMVFKIGKIGGGDVVMYSVGDHALLHVHNYKREKHYIQEKLTRIPEISPVTSFSLLPPLAALNPPAVYTHLFVPLISPFTHPYTIISGGYSAQPSFWQHLFRDQYTPVSLLSSHAAIGTFAKDILYRRPCIHTQIHTQPHLQAGNAFFRDNNQYIIPTSHYSTSTLHDSYITTHEAHSHDTELATTATTTSTAAAAAGGRAPDLFREIKRLALADTYIGYNLPRHPLYVHTHASPHTYPFSQAHMYSQPYGGHTRVLPISTTTTPSSLYAVTAASSTSTSTSTLTSSINHDNADAGAGDHVRGRSSGPTAISNGSRDESRGEPTNGVSTGLGVAGVITDHAHTRGLAVVPCGEVVVQAKLVVRPQRKHRPNRSRSRSRSRSHSYSGSDSEGSSRGGGGRHGRSYGHGYGYAYWYGEQLMKVMGRGGSGNGSSTGGSGDGDGECCDEKEKCRDRCEECNGEQCSNSKDSCERTPQDIHMDILQTPGNSEDPEKSPFSASKQYIRLRVHHTVNAALGMLIEGGVAERMAPIIDRAVKRACIASVYARKRALIERGKAVFTSAASNGSVVHIGPGSGSDGAYGNGSGNSNGYGNGNGNDGSADTNKPVLLTRYNSSHSLGASSTTTSSSSAVSTSPSMQPSASVPTSTLPASLASPHSALALTTVTYPTLASLPPLIPDLIQQALATVDTGGLDIDYTHVYTLVNRIATELYLDELEVRIQNSLLRKSMQARESSGASHFPGNGISHFGELHDNTENKGVVGEKQEEQDKNGNREAEERIDGNLNEKEMHIQKDKDKDKRESKEGKEGTEEDEVKEGRRARNRYTHERNGAIGSGCRDVGDVGSDEVDDKKYTANGDEVEDGGVESDTSDNSGYFHLQIISGKNHYSGFSNSDSGMSTSSQIPKKRAHTARSHSAGMSDDAGDAGDTVGRGPDEQDDGLLSASAEAEAKTKVRVGVVEQDIQERKAHSASVATLQQPISNDNTTLQATTQHQQQQHRSLAMAGETANAGRGSITKRLRLGSKARLGMGNICGLNGADALPHWRVAGGACGLTLKPCNAPTILAKATSLTAGNKLSSCSHANVSYVSVQDHHTASVIAQSLTPQHHAGKNTLSHRENAFSRPVDLRAQVEAQQRSGAASTFSDRLWAYAVKTRYGLLATINNALHTALLREGSETSRRAAHGQGGRDDGNTTTMGVGDVGAAGVPGLVPAVSSAIPSDYTHTHAHTHQQRLRSTSVGGMNDGAHNHIQPNLHIHTHTNASARTTSNGNTVLGHATTGMGESGKDGHDSGASTDVSMGMGLGAGADISSGDVASANSNAGPQHTPMTHVHGHSHVPHHAHTSGPHSHPHSHIPIPSHITASHAPSQMATHENTLPSSAYNGTPHHPAASTGAIAGAGTSTGACVAGGVCVEEPMGDVSGVNKEKLCVYCACKYRTYIANRRTHGSSSNSNIAQTNGKIQQTSGNSEFRNLAVGEIPRLHSHGAYEAVGSMADDNDTIPKQKKTCIHVCAGREQGITLDNSPCDVLFPPESKFLAHSSNSATIDAAVRVRAAAYLRQQSLSARMGPSMVAYHSSPSRANTIVMIAGGVGITPILGFLERFSGIMAISRVLCEEYWARVWLSWAQTYMLKPTTQPITTATYHAQHTDQANATAPSSSTSSSSSSYASASSTTSSSTHPVTAALGPLRLPPAPLPTPVPAPEPTLTTTPALEATVAAPSASHVPSSAAHLPSSVVPTVPMSVVELDKARTNSHTATNSFVDQRRAVLQSLQTYGKEISATIATCETPGFFSPGITKTQKFRSAHRNTPFQPSLSLSAPPAVREWLSKRVCCAWACSDPHLLVWVCTRIHRMCMTALDKRQAVVVDEVTWESAQSKRVLLDALVRNGICTAEKNTTDAEFSENNNTHIPNSDSSTSAVMGSGATDQTLFSGSPTALHRPLPTQTPTPILGLEPVMTPSSDIKAPHTPTATLPLHSAPSPQSLYRVQSLCAPTTSPHTLIALRHAQQHLQRTHAPFATHTAAHTRTEASAHAHTQQQPQQIVQGGNDGADRGVDNGGDEEYSRTRLPQPDVSPAGRGRVGFTGGTGRGCGNGSTDSRSVKSTGNGSHASGGGSGMGMGGGGSVRTDSIADEILAQLHTPNATAVTRELYGLGLVHVDVYYTGPCVDILRAAHRGDSRFSYHALYSVFQRLASVATVHWGEEEGECDSSCEQDLPANIACVCGVSGGNEGACGSCEGERTGLMTPSVARSDRSDTASNSNTSSSSSSSSGNVSSCSGGYNSACGSATTACPHTNNHNNNHNHHAASSPFGPRRACRHASSGKAVLGGLHVHLRPLDSRHVVERYTKTVLRVEDEDVVDTRVSTGAGMGMSVDAGVVGDGNGVVLAQQTHATTSSTVPLTPTTHTLNPSSLSSASSSSPSLDAAQQELCSLFPHPLLVKHLSPHDTHQHWRRVLSLCDPFAWHRVTLVQPLVHTHNAARVAAMTAVDGKLDAEAWLQRMVRMERARNGKFGIGKIWDVSGEISRFGAITAPHSLYETITESIRVLSGVPASASTYTNADAQIHRNPLRHAANDLPPQTQRGLWFLACGPDSLVLDAERRVAQRAGDTNKEEFCL